VSIRSLSAVALTVKGCCARVSEGGCIRGLIKSSTERFSDRVEQYDRYRPRYPNALLDFLVRKIPPPAAVADIGSGTGILSGQLLQFGYQVMAVEPNKPMREAAERRLSEHQAFHSVDGTAEFLQRKSWNFSRTARSSYSRFQTINF